jgi:hypothetical protein
MKFVRWTSKSIECELACTVGSFGILTCCRLDDQGPTAVRDRKCFRTQQRHRNN